ncbi:hypothetical protein V8G54_000565 [Vigna mungo]|uniref:Uncharacterized protein n=1 Tax=Vigna mungo TaxID=3915 RepID=A0AAQ3SAP3_VIGMU
MSFNKNAATGTSSTFDPTISSICQEIPRHINGINSIKLNSPPSFPSILLLLTSRPTLTPITPRLIQRRPRVRIPTPNIIRKLRIIRNTGGASPAVPSSRPLRPRRRPARLRRRRPGQSSHVYQRTAEQTRVPRNHHHRPCNHNSTTLQTKFATHVNQNRAPQHGATQIHAGKYVQTPVPFYVHVAVENQTRIEIACGGERARPIETLLARERGRMRQWRRRRRRRRRVVAK